MEVLNTRNNNNTHDKNIGESANTIKTSPVLPTVRRVGGGHKTKTNQWQDFIDREQNSVDHLIQNSFATLRKGRILYFSSNVNSFFKIIIFHISLFIYLIYLTISI